MPNFRRDLYLNANHLDSPRTSLVNPYSDINSPQSSAVPSPRVYPPTQQTDFERIARPWVVPPVSQPLLPQVYICYLAGAPKPLPLQPPERPSCPHLQCMYTWRDLMIKYSRAMEDHSRAMQKYAHEMEQYEHAKQRYERLQREYDKNPGDYGRKFWS